ncbi:hypothetical protein ABTL82_20075, partial [Acinetobacter baumannii]
EDKSAKPKIEAALPIYEELVEGDEAYRELDDLHQDEEELGMAGGSTIPSPMNVINVDGVNWKLVDDVLVDPALQSTYE